MRDPNDTDTIDLFTGNLMRPLKRKPVNKRRSAKTFRKQTTRTKAANLNGPQRGGWRF